MVRHDDEWWMNHRNTYGRLTYVKDAKRYETPRRSKSSPDTMGVLPAADNTAPDISPLSPHRRYRNLLSPLSPNLKKSRHLPR